MIKKKKTTLKVTIEEVDEVEDNVQVKDDNVVMRVFRMNDDDVTEILLTSDICSDFSTFSQITEDKDIDEEINEVKTATVSVARDELIKCFEFNKKTYNYPAPCNWRSYFSIFGFDNEAWFFILGIK